MPRASPRTARRCGRDSDRAVAPTHPRPTPPSRGQPVTGNATFRHRDVALLAVVGIEAPVVVPSTVFDQQLAPTLKRLRLPRGLLSRVAGVHERRWWDDKM